MTENQSPSDDTNIFSPLLGKAVIDQWGDLPRTVQEQLFEAAVAAGSEAGKTVTVRERLAIFLHDHHPRTEAGEVSASRLRDVSSQDGGLAST